MSGFLITKNRSWPYPSQAANCRRQGAVPSPGCKFAWTIKFADGLVSIDSHIFDKRIISHSWISTKIRNQTRLMFKCLFGAEHLGLPGGATWRV
jgi:hypothetical protein